MMVERAIPEQQIAELRGEMIDEYAHLERYAPAVQYQYVDHHVSHRKIREHCAQPAHGPILGDIPRQSQADADASQPTTVASRNTSPSLLSKFPLMR